MLKHLVTIALALTISACAWVKTNPEAEGVRVATQADVADCKRLGTASGKVLYQVFFINRSVTKVQGELNALAQNEAAKLGGNTVVPTSTIEKGRQEFAVYQCGRG